MHLWAVIPKGRCTGIRQIRYKTMCFLTVRYRNHLWPKGKRNSGLWQQLSLVVGFLFCWGGEQRPIIKPQKLEWIATYLHHQMNFKTPVEVKGPHRTAAGQLPRSHGPPETSYGLTGLQPAGWQHVVDIRALLGRICHDVALQEQTGYNSWKSDKHERGKAFSFISLTMQLKTKYRYKAATFKFWVNFFFLLVLWFHASNTRKGK